ncbi:MAG: Peptidase propeptide [Acidobacteriaceae bacterium]|nr:Peptidase propeptide [Acidobacteriaceae bacterium]
MSIRAGRLIGPSLFVIFLCLFSARAQGQGPSHPDLTPSLIVQPVDETRLTLLKGNTHPLARLQYDQGAAPLDLPMNRMLLVLRRSDAQEMALRKLLDNQQDKLSPTYHKWLTPEAFGSQFGPSDQDIQTVAAWLQSHGFVVAQVAKGRNVIEFSGTAAQVQEALHTEIHKYVVNGEEHWANAKDPAIPAALTPVISGVDSLNNFQKKSMNLFAGTFSRLKDTGKLIPLNPQFTFPGGCTQAGNCYGIVPYDFATIYDVLPLWNAGIDGTGETIAIVGRTNINPQDVADFRSLFGLPANSPNIILNGPDPGINGDEGEADIDIQWSGAVAKNATIDFVTSESTETTDGVDLSAFYIVDNNLAPVMSESYGQCELSMGVSGNNFYGALWEQAAAQGISVFVSSGDNGAAGCDNPGSPAQNGFNVNGLASTLFNAAVGGTDFNQYNKWSSYWNSTNNATTQESAIGYIPETAWNDSCVNPLFVVLGYGATAEAACNNTQAANWLDSTGGGGGKSAGWQKPSWQSGTGVPNDNVRDLPDISLFASSGFAGSFYVVCQQDLAGSCSVNSFAGYGGTSVASPAFAGIMALVNQKMQLPQGNPGFFLYKLASHQPSAFHDVPAGSTIAMPCVSGSPNCTVNNSAHTYGILSGYATGTTYDLATGLGSVDANNLVTNWNKAAFTATTTSLTLSPLTITHGQPVNVNISISPTTATGDASLLVSTGVGNVAGQAIDGFTVKGGGSVSATTSLLPGGTNYKVFAHYAGDGTYGGSYSSPVTVNVAKENSKVYMPGVLLAGSSGKTATVTYGQEYWLRVDVQNSQGAFCNPPPSGEIACPTGNVTITDNGNPFGVGTYTLNSAGYLETVNQLVELPAGTHSLSAQYGGDNSYNASTTPVVITVNKYITSLAVPAAQGTFANQPITLSTTVDNGTVAFYSSPPTGQVTFYSNGTVIPGTVTYNTNFGFLNAFLTANFPSPGTYTLTAAYSGDGNYTASTSPASPLHVTFPPPAVSLTPPTQTVSAGSAASLTALVDTANTTTAPTGTVSFISQLTGVPIAGTPTYTQTTDATGNKEMQAVLSYTPASSDTVSANYSGDANYPPGSSGSVQVIVSGSDFTFSLNPNSVSVTPGQSVTVSIPVGFQSTTSAVSFSASPCAGLPAESTCSVSPSSVTSNSTVVLTINTTSAHQVGANRPHNLSNRGIWATSSAITFAGIFLLGGAKKRRGCRSLLSLAVFAFLLSVPACGGGGGNSGGGGHIDPGTPAGTSTVTVTATSGTITHTATFTLVVQ